MPTGIFNRADFEPNKGLFKKGVKTGRVPKHAFKKGYTPWNKGLTKETSSKILLTSRKISKALKGHRSWSIGKTFCMSEPAKEKIRAAAKLRIGKKNNRYKHGLCKTPEYQFLQREKAIKKLGINEYRKKKSKALREYRRLNPEQTRLLYRLYMYKKNGSKGSHTLGEWELLKKQYGFTCPKCKKSEPKIKLTEDHIIPVSKGGSSYIENIQPLCASCNSSKGAKIISFSPEEIK